MRGCLPDVWVQEQALGKASAGAFSICPLGILSPGSVSPPTSALSWKSLKKNVQNSGLTFTHIAEHFQSPNRRLHQGLRNTCLYVMMEGYQE